jgi:molybdenum cofactor guanylyltransferase
VTAPPSPAACTAAILCGGRGQRMGVPRKPLLEVQGQPILARQLAVLTPLFAEVVLLADDAAPFAPFGRRVLLDPEPGHGPLPAIAAALRTLAAPALFVVAGDMPYLSAAAVSLTVTRALGEDVDLAAPWVDRWPEPLHACYRPTCLAAMERALDAGRLSVQGFYPEVRVARVDEAVLRRIDPTLAFLRGVNVPADLKA